MAHALTFTSATCVVNWEDDWVVGQFAESDDTSMWLFARAKGATAGGFGVADSVPTESRQGVITPQDDSESGIGR